METTRKEKIRETIRERYGKIATRGNLSSALRQAISCCGQTETNQSVTQTTSCCGSKDVSLEKLATIIGYSKEDIQAVPDGANMGLGCGNPVALASLQEGETVVDLGSGGGFDCFLAAKAVGQEGKVIGVDMTAEMVSKARKNAETIKAVNVDFRLGEIENLPIANNCADIIMSNCVINLSQDKSRVYSEAFRVLKPGGRLAISDILATTALPDEVRENLTLISACVGGASPIEETKEMLKEAGFQDIRITPKTNNRDLMKEWIPEIKNATFDYVVSAYIEAVKPV